MKGGQQMPVTQVSGVRIHYKDEGQGYPVLFMHGFASDLQSWDEQVPVLVDKYRVVRYDCRGHGGSESPDHQDDYSQEILVDEALGLLDAIGLDKAHVCGLSMGGGTALNLALKHPDRVSAAIIASTGAGSGAEESFLEGFKALTDMLDRGDLESFAKTLASSPVAAVFSKLRPDLIETTKERRMRNNPGGLAHIIRGAIMRRKSIFALEDQLKNMKVPALIVAGELDQACRGPADFMGRHIPRSRLVVFPETGHVVNLERREDFNREMLGFLDDVACGRM